MAVSINTNIAEGTWGATNPSDLNYLKPTGFKFQIHNLPNVSYFCQSANIPSFGIGYTETDTPLTKLFNPGEKPFFGDLLIRFLVQENMANYIELYNWLIGLSFPESHEQFKAYQQSQQYRFPGGDTKKLPAITNFSDADFFILDSDNNPNVKITYQDLFPTSLEALDFDISDGQVEYLVGIASFKYRHYTIESI